MMRAFLAACRDLLAGLFYRPVPRQPGVDYAEALEERYRDPRCC